MSYLPPGHYMPLDPDDVGRLRDMIDYAQEAIALLGDMSSEQMNVDRRTFLAVSRCVEIVGEVGWKLSKDLKCAFLIPPPIWVRNPPITPSGNWRGDSI
jgi:hypothetical protein